MTCENAQNEYYLTDIVEKATREGQNVSAYLLPDATEALGVNTLIELSAVNALLLRRSICHFIEHGAIFTDPNSCWIDACVSIAPGVRIGPNVQLRGGTSIGADVEIEGSALIIDSEICSSAVIRFGCRIEHSKIGSAATVGPFAHLRPGTILEEGVRIGNFVETKNALLKRDAKASHLTYLGDCSVGESTNIGAGTITCNYDGVKKSLTQIGSNAFVGSNSVLIAPVEIGDGAYIAAASTINKNVPKDALAIGRARQENKEGWAARKRRDI